MGRINIPLSAPPILADVGAPAVAPQGASGGDTWDYAVVGVTSDDRRSLVSSNGTTAAGSASLGDNDFNRVTWVDVAGYIRYEIFRQVSADAGIGVGLVGTRGPGVQSFDDHGALAQAVTPSAANETGAGRVVDLASFEGSVEAQLENVGVGTYEVQTSPDKAAWTIEGAALTADGVRVIGTNRRFARIECTAFTSGTPRGYVVGDGSI